MKNWLTVQLGGPLGAIIRPILSAIIGTFVGIVYQQIWVGIYQVTWLRVFCEKVIANLDPHVVQSLTPTAIGLTAGTAAWLYLYDWIVSRLKHGNTVIQQAVNASALPVTVKEDGIITKDGETAQAVSRLAYEAIYPEDTQSRGSAPQGMPEVRNPLP